MGSRSPPRAAAVELHPSSCNAGTCMQSEHTLAKVRLDRPFGVDPAVRTMTPRRCWTPSLGAAAVLLLVLWSSLGVGSVPATPASGHHNCEDCVAAGWGWCPNVRQCGGFQNTACSGTVTDYQRSRAAQQLWLAEQGHGQHLLRLSQQSIAAALDDHPLLLVHFQSIDSLSSPSSSQALSSGGGGTGTALKVLDAAASRLAEEGHPGRIAVYALAGTQEEARFLAAQDVFFGGATSTYAFQHHRPVRPYLGALQIGAVLEFVRAAPAAAGAGVVAGGGTASGGDGVSTGGGEDLPVPATATTTPPQSLAVGSAAADPVPQSASAVAATGAAAALAASLPQAPAEEAAAAGGSSGGAPQLTANHRADAIRAASRNLVKELTMSTAGAATKSHIKLQVLVCANFSGVHAGAVDALAEAAVELGGRFLFLHLDSADVANAPIMKRVSGSLAECPAVRVADTRGKGFKVSMPPHPAAARPGGRYAFNTAAGLVALARDFEARQLRRSVLSEPRPRALTQPVARIVGSMFNESVMDASGDVVLYLYMDSCPHCKKFTEIYKQVALELRSTNTAGLTLVSMRGTRNDVDHDLVAGSSYPRVYLFVDGEKETPYEYLPSGDPATGVMSAESFRNFLEVYSGVDIVWWDEYVRQRRGGAAATTGSEGGASVRITDDAARDEL